MTETHGCDSFGVTRPVSRHCFTVLPKRLPTDRQTVMPTPAPAVSAIASAIGAVFLWLLVAPVFVLLLLLAFRCFPAHSGGFFSFFCMLYLLERWSPTTK